MDSKPISFNQMILNLFIIILGYNYLDITCFMIFSIYSFYELSYFRLNDRYNMIVFNNFLKYYGIGIFLAKINFIVVFSGMIIGSIFSTFISYETIYQIIFSKMTIFCIESIQSIKTSKFTNIINKYIHQLYVIITNNFIDYFYNNNNTESTEFSDNEVEEDNKDNKDNKDKKYNEKDTEEQQTIM